MHMKTLVFSANLALAFIKAKTFQLAPFNPFLPCVRNHQSGNTSAMYQLIATFGKNHFIANAHQFSTQDN